MVERCKIMTRTRRSSSPVISLDPETVSSLHVDLGLPVCLLFGDISLYHIIFSIVWQKLVIPTRFFLESWNSYFVFPL
jgi:hypothetical protein